MKPEGTLMQSFVPGPDTSGDFRTALGRFGTGVTVVTCASEIGPLGITANSFASVSLDPPLVLWSPARFSRRFGAFSGAGHFAIHVMAAEQADICRQFSAEGDDWEGIDWVENAQGVPVIANCLSVFECETHARHDGGDHEIIVGRVERVTTRPGEALMFYQGGYGGFAAP